MRHSENEGDRLLDVDAHMLTWFEPDPQNDRWIETIRTVSGAYAGYGMEKQQPPYRYRKTVELLCVGGRANAYVDEWALVAQFKQM